NRSRWIQWAFFTCFSAMTTNALAAIPQISTVEGVAVDKGAEFKYAMSLSSSVGKVNWTKAYGPEGVKVDAVTGAVTWKVPSAIPSETVYVGVKASNGDGSDVEYFMVHVGVPKVVTVGSGGKYSTLRAAYANERQAGTTIVVKPGEYGGDDFQTGFTQREFSVPVNGNTSAYTTVIAQDPGTVTFTNNAEIMIYGGVQDVHHIAFKGLFVKDGQIGTAGKDCTASNCKPHHVKFEANGGSDDNNVPFFTTQSDKILFENNFAFGGGRSKFLAYKATSAVFRRNVARYDKSDNAVNGEPKNTFIIYNSQNILLQNNIAIDGDQSQFISGGYRTGEFGCVGTDGSKGSFNRNLQLNTHIIFTSLTGSCFVDFNDTVIWAAHLEREGLILSRGAGNFNRLTVGDAYSKDGTPYLVNGYGSTMRGVKNSLFHQIKHDSLFYGLEKRLGLSLGGITFDRTGVSNINISSFTGKIVNCCTDINMSTVSNLNPIYNSSSNPNGGLRYIIRPEPNSNLSGLASDSGTIGGTITTFEGFSGTLVGDTGSTAETAAPMWPMPMEEIMHKRMASYSHTGPTYSGPSTARVISGRGSINGARGFAAPSQTLTHYVWGFLGQSVPPFGVTATGAEGKVTVQWNSPAPEERGQITSYKVYDYDSRTDTKSNPRTVSGSNFSLDIAGITAGVEKEFVVTAVHRATGESGFSYPAVTEAMEGEGLKPVANTISVKKIPVD
ncbi:MAG: fibronectin type III domain-containing protein, partial [Pseudomonadota bacterium]